MTRRGGADRPTPAELAIVFRQFVIDTEVAEESPERLDEEARLATLQRYDLLDTPPEGAFDRITSLAARTIGAPVSTVSIVDRDRIWFKSHHGIDAEQIARDPGFCARVVQTGEVVHVPDGRLDPIASGNPLVTELGVRFYAGVPLVASDGHVLGSLSVLGFEPRVLSPNELAILRSLGEMVTHEMELRLATRRVRSLEH
jgi:GAF domain-containing protein